jgi:integrase
MLILTGARLNEIGRMTWAEVDFDRKLWTLPASRAKNGRTLTLPLSDQALVILGAQPRGTNVPSDASERTEEAGGNGTNVPPESEFVFAVKGAPVANWSSAQET